MLLLIALVQTIKQSKNNKFLLRFFSLLMLRSHAGAGAVFDFQSLFPPSFFSISHRKRENSFPTQGVESLILLIIYCPQTNLNTLLFIAISCSTAFNVVKHVCALNRKALKRENLRSEITKDDSFYGTWEAS